MDWAQVTCITVSHSNHYTKVFSLLVWHCKWSLIHTWVILSNLSNSSNWTKIPSFWKRTCSFFRDTFISKAPQTFWTVTFGLVHTEMIQMRMLIRSSCFMFWIPCKKLLFCVAIFTSLECNCTKAESKVTENLLSLSSSVKPPLTKRIDRLEMELFSRWGRILRRAASLASLPSSLP